MRPTAKLAAIATAVCAVVMAPAGIASAEETPQEVLNRLQNEGYQVNVDRVGSAPINQCIVTNVRNPQTVTELVRVYDGRDKNGDIDWDFIEVIKSRSISVTLNCTR
jgi:hypothetical protein